MNAIAFCLDLILATLLLAALFVGLRLDRKLKALRDSQSGFLRAVAELDASIVKAQDSLGALKITATQAEAAIADRIQDARGATARLDQQAKAATAAADKLEQLLERYPASTAREGRDPGPLELRNRASEHLQSRRPIARDALARPSPVQERAPAPSRGLSLGRDERMSRGRDDDLFEAIEPALRAARGARR
jgi:hypothetical protein